MDHQLRDFAEAAFEVTIRVPFLNFESNIQKLFRVSSTNLNRLAACRSTFLPLRSVAYFRTAVIEAHQLFEMQCSDTLCSRSLQQVPSTDQNRTPCIQASRALQCLLLGLLIAFSKAQTTASSLGLSFLFSSTSTNTSQGQIIKSWSAGNLLGHAIDS